MSGPVAVRGDLALGGELAPGAVVVDGGRIVEVLRAPREGALPPHTIEAAIVAPGLIDLQVNGGYGVDVATDAAAMATLARRLPEAGVTAYLPTLISSTPAGYAASFALIAAAPREAGAIALGLHLEGPLLAVARKGAHPADAIRDATPALLDALVAAAPPGCPVRLVTLAPERPGAIACIRLLRERGVAVSLGHTDATAEAFVAGVDAGATMATHLYNAMSPFTHRAPGAIGAALADDRVAVGLIADGIHSHPLALRLAVRAKGTNRIALVSDLMAAGGMPPGAYRLAGREVAVDGESARLPDGTLAGAILPLAGAVRNMVRWSGVSPAAAMAMASELPARLLGLPDRGRLTAGSRADISLFDEGLSVTATMVGGEIVFDRAGG